MTVTAGLLGLTFGIVRTEAYGWGSAADARARWRPDSRSSALFLVIEGRSSSRPLMPLRIFRLAHADRRPT